MNNLDLSVALATAPSSAYAELHERPKFWFPLLLVVLTTAALMYWYYSIVDIDWLKDAMFGNHPKFHEMTEEQRAAAMSLYSRKTMLWGSVASAVLLLPIFFLLQALYLLLAAKVTKLPQGFKHWFSFISWSSIPALLGVVVAAILLFMRDTPQLSPSVMQPLSLNELAFHRPYGSAGHTLLESLSITGVLSWILMIIGVRTWSQRSWSFSAVLILLPVVVIYGAWAAFAFR